MVQVESVRAGTPSDPQPPLNLPDIHLERELFALVRQERLARDTGDFELLGRLYWPDSIIRVTWFTGTISEFIEVSRDQHSRGRGRGIHVINPIRCHVSPDKSRATVESQGEIHIRPKIHGVECDVVARCRFFSKLERREGIWRLLTFDSIYCKDRIDPLYASDTPALCLDQQILRSARPTYRHLTYLNLTAGFVVPDDLPGDDRPNLVDEFYQEATRWLQASQLNGSHKAVNGAT